MPISGMRVGAILSVQPRKIVAAANATIFLMGPNAGIRPRRTRRMGASIACMPGSFNEAETRRRLE